MCQKEYLETLSDTSKECFYESLKTISDIRKKVDYLVCNLETPVAGEEYGIVDKQYEFNAPVEFAEALKDSGVDMVMAANNHCLDRGIEGLKATINNLKKINLEYIGLHAKKESSFKIQNINGIKVGFVNFTYGTNAFCNNNYLKFSERYIVDLLQKQELNNRVIRKIWNGSNLVFRAIKKGCRMLGLGQFDVNVYERRENDFFEKRRFIKAIKQCRKAGAEIVIVLPHIGGQYNDAPTEYTKSICELAIKCGADAVIANHEHCIHEINTSYIREGKLIAYSIGNYMGIAGVLDAPYDKDSEYSIGINMNIESSLKIKYSFSIYKTIFDNGLKTYNICTLINNCKDPFGKIALENKCKDLAAGLLKIDKNDVDIKESYNL